jgi:hypothetical protein
VATSALPAVIRTPASSCLLFHAALPPLAEAQASQLALPPQEGFPELNQTRRSAVFSRREKAGMPHPEKLTLAHT